MAPHQVGDNPWLKRVLIPFWVIRIFFMVIIVGLYAWALSLVASDYAGSYLAGPIVLMILLAICLILDIVSIILYARRKLKPKVFLIFNVFQTLFWLVIWIIEIVNASGNPSGAATGAVILGLIVLYVPPPPFKKLEGRTQLTIFPHHSLSFVGLLIYASIIYHRTRKATRRGEYQPAPNPAHPGNVELQPNTPYAAPQYNALPQQQQTAYYGAQAPQPHSYYSVPAPQGLGAQQPQPYYGASQSPAGQTALPYPMAATQELQSKPSQFSMISSPGSPPPPQQRQQHTQSPTQPYVLPAPYPHAAHEVPAYSRPQDGAIELPSKPSERGM